MKKNVWIINHYAGETLFDKGGRHYWLAKYLKRDGYEPTVFCSNTMHGEAKRYLETDALWEMRTAEEIGVPFVFVKARPYMGNGKQRILNMMDFYRHVERAAKEYAAAYGRPDVIFASSVHPLTIVAGIRLAKYFGVKCVAEIRDLWPESLIAYGIAGPRHPAVLCLRRLEKWIYRKADAVVFTMEGAYDYIAEQGWEKDVPRSKVYYINNGVDLEQFGYNRTHFTVNDPDLDDAEHFKVVYTGSIRKVNNLGLLLDAAKEVKDPRIKFLIWGSGDELPVLRQRLADEHITNVVFKGRVEKQYVPSIVSRADLNFAHNTASPLFRFGISFNKLFDYLAAEKPVLTDFSCRYNPAVKAGAGVNVEEPSASHVAAAIEQLSRAAGAVYGEYCRRAGEAVRQYDFRYLTEQLEQILFSVSGTGKQ